MNTLEKRLINDCVKSTSSSLSYTIKDWIFNLPLYSIITVSFVGNAVGEALKGDSRKIYTFIGTGILLLLSLSIYRCSYSQYKVYKVYKKLLINDYILDCTL